MAIRKLVLSDIPERQWDYFGALKASLGAHALVLSDGGLVGIDDRAVIWGGRFMDALAKCEASLLDTCEDVFTSLFFEMERGF